MGGNNSLQFCRVQEDLQVIFILDFDVFCWYCYVRLVISLFACFGVGLEFWLRSCYCCNENRYDTLKINNNWGNSTCSNSAESHLYFCTLLFSDNFIFSWAGTKADLQSLYLSWLGEKQFIQRINFGIIKFITCIANVYWSSSIFI